MNRRTFLGGAAAALAGSVPLAGAHPKLEIGVTDWNLGLTGKVEAVALARKLGFEGVQISLGRKIENNQLPLASAEVQARYLEAAKTQGVALVSTCLDILHTNYLKNDPLGRKWVADSIPITKKLNAKVILLPFFGKGALSTPAEMDYVGDVLRELGPEAEKAGVVLALENTISAPDNMRIMDRSRSKAVLVYYDIGNSANGGFQYCDEIRLLGKKRICQLHFKDNPHYLGEGKIDMVAVLHAIADIEYRGYVVLETDSPSKAIEADMKRNLTYVKRLMSQNGM